MTRLNRRTVLAAALASAALTACSRQDNNAAPAAATPAAAVNAEEAYQLVSGGAGVQVGQMMAAHTVYVLFDPQCPHCATLWAEAKPLLGKLKMVWIPVQLLGADSAPMGAAILASPQPVEALERHEALVNQRVKLTPPQADAASLAKVAANTELFKKLGAESVPVVYFRHAKTGQYGSHAGAMPTAQLQELTGV
ncbi:thioredoxin fold domain-containing protein [Aquabacterium sp. A7-Y]|uniref:thioredoxin fold domain-containing protein n=1 Tax=Aquabacterium sp. A7-Y TaxID=1349605 RepID=UPI00223D8D13|nr:thioredoxin fold domain-containing protein [Aquabacterium sp. A7-Y]MCW7538439.1 thioredoxin fold domain-containing protein [Aquabacterium sp. A7-Y]